MVYHELNKMRQINPELIKELCIVNGEPFALSDLENMGYQEFSLRSKLNMPSKLYKYFPNKTEQKVDPNTFETYMVNYSQNALETNEVFLNSPANFDDVYDSNIVIDHDQYIMKRLQHYSSIFQCEGAAINNNDLKVLLRSLSAAICDAMRINKGEYHIIESFGLSREATLSAQAFFLHTSIMIQKGAQAEQAIQSALEKEYQEICSCTAKAFRISCFATTPFSQLMWGGSYADCHKGFCIEYDIRPNDPSYQEVFYNLFPVVYSKQRTDITSTLLCWHDSKITIDMLWNIYFNGILRKSIDWAFQNEWRLLKPVNSSSQGITVPFFPISKVYLGNRMDPISRKKIIEICKKKDIPYIGVRRSMDRFEMQACDILCENCPSYTTAL